METTLKSFTTQIETFSSDLLNFSSQKELLNDMTGKLNGISDAIDSLSLPPSAPTEQEGQTKANEIPILAEIGKVVDAALDLKLPRQLLNPVAWKAAAEAEALKKNNVANLPEPSTSAKNFSTKFAHFVGTGVFNPGCKQPLRASPATPSAALVQPRKQKKKQRQAPQPPLLNDVNELCSVVVTNLAPEQKANDLKDYVLCKITCAAEDLSVKNLTPKKIV